MNAMRHMTLRERVLSGLLIEPATGCLLWQRSVHPKGYAKVQDGLNTVTVHRLMYEWFVGPIPPGMQLDHLCRVRRCASPSHLEPVTCRENLLRGAGRGGRLRRLAS